MGQAFNISDNIGYDGFSYFCRRCGKAGYQRATQVRSHLAMCPGTMIRKGITLPANKRLQAVNPLSEAGLQIQANKRLQAVNPALLQGFSNGQQQQQPLVVDPYNNQLVVLEQRVALIENEYTHMLQTYNNSQTSTVLGNSIPQWLLIGIIVLFGFLLVQSLGKGCGDSCDTKSGRSSSNIRDRIAGKMSDKMIDFAFKGLSGR